MTIFVLFEDGVLRAQLNALPAPVPIPVPVPAPAAAPAFGC
jgi:hypothetical protein